MAFGVDVRRFVTGIVAIACTASLVWFGTGLDPWWPLFWLAPVPVLLFSHRASWWGTAVVAALAWLVGYLNMWHYYFGVIHIPPVMLACIYAGQSLMFALAVLLYRALLRRAHHWVALLALPAAWVSFEYLLDATWPHGTAGSLAYSQLAFLPFLQLASVTGPWGMSFLLLLFPASLAIGFHLRSAASRRALHIVASSVGVLVLVLAFGTARLASSDAGPRVKVGLIASDAPTSPAVADEGEPTTRLFQAYADQAAKLALRGAQVIVLPEKLGVAVDPDTHEMDALFQAVADQTRARVVVGLIHVAAPAKYNEARVYAPAAPVQAYAKHHMLPPFESNLEPGTTLTLLPDASGIWGVEICKDMDFTPLSREYGRAGAGLMLVPAWDFDLDRTWHGHIALMRGVEGGFSIVRAAKQGYLTVSDNRGRIVAEARSDSAPFATLIADVPVAHAATFYVRFGNWFAWLALLLCAFAILRCVGRGGRAGFANRKH